MIRLSLLASKAMARAQTHTRSQSEAIVIAAVAVVKASLGLRASAAEWWRNCYADAAIDDDETLAAAGVRPGRTHTHTGEARALGTGFNQSARNKAAPLNLNHFRSPIRDPFRSPAPRRQPSGRRRPAQQVPAGCAQLCESL